VENGHVAVGGDDIDAVRHYLHLVLRLRHRHGCDALQDFGEDAGMAGVEMRNQHEGHAGIGGDMAKELLEGLQASGGSAQADNGKTAVGSRLVSSGS